VNWDVAILKLGLVALHLIWLGMAFAPRASGDREALHGR
jgi:hypothetical protein